MSEYQRFEPREVGPPIQPKLGEFNVMGSWFRAHRMEDNTCVEIYVLEIEVISYGKKSISANNIPILMVIITM